MLQPSKNPFIDTLRAVINDVKWFLFLLLLTMWGFCMSFYILFRRDQKKEARLSCSLHLHDALSTCIQISSVCKDLRCLDASVLLPPMTLVPRVLGQTLLP